MHYYHFVSTVLLFMYPDRATFERMVNEIPDISISGRQTLIALYDGPLRLRQILSAINTRDGANNNTRDLSESAQSYAEAETIY